MLIDPKLWQHQKEAVAKAREFDSYALFFEMGCGKTATAITILKEKFAAEGRVMKTLILCPLIVVENWKREWAMFSRISQLKIQTLTGPGLRRLRDFKEFEAPIVITNLDAITGIPTLWREIQARGFECLIVDESHRFKNPKARRTKDLIRFIDNSKLKHKLILSGTPILNTPLDIWSQFRIMNSKIFGENYFAFCAKYFYNANQGNPNATWPDLRPFPGIEIDIHKKIYSQGMRVEKKDVLDLPPLVRQTVEVPLSGKQMVLYEQMKKDFISYMGKHVMVAEMAVTKALRLQQIVSGVFSNDEGETIPIQNDRLKALKEVIVGIGKGHKLIIWACFRASYEDIAKVLDGLDLKWDAIIGGQKVELRQRVVDEFNHGKTQVLIANQGAGGTGVNLTAASYAIYFSRSFNLEHDQQSEARNHRGGSEIHKKITRIDLVTPDTIDTYILEALRQKKNMVKSIMDLKDKL